MARLSPSQYCTLALQPANESGYAALPAQLLSAERSLSAEGGTKVSEYNRILLRFLLEEFQAETALWVQPPSILELYDGELRRLEDICTAQNDDYFRFENDLYRKDLAILLRRLIPFGAEFATPYSGIPRSLLVRAGAKQAIRFLQVLAASRGASPFLELHMHPGSSSEFTPSGWIECYERLADFLAFNPEFLGVQSTSWFLDPALKKISPRLAYLREVPEQCGACILFAGADKEGKSGALAKSPTRLKLYESGEYQPRLYTRIWPRIRILQRHWRSLADDTANEVLHHTAGNDVHL